MTTCLDSSVDRGGKTHMLDAVAQILWVFLLRAKCGKSWTVASIAGDTLLASKQNLIAGRLH